MSNDVITAIVRHNRAFTARKTEWSETIGFVTFIGAHDRFIRQERLFADEKGHVIWKGMKDFFSPEEQEELKRIARKMKRAADKYPELKRKLHKSEE